MSDIQLLKQDSMETIVQKAASVRPAPRQVRWQELEFIAFLHFGINTFTDREWGDGTESPEIFNPTDFDAEQIVTSIKDAQMKAVILTCKHHDGFCLWPSKYTEHSVKNSPWKNGKGDIVREISDACRRHGLKFGVYLSPWDRHDYRYGDSPAYNEYYLNQLTELLTEYGEIFDLWLDGACAEGPNGKKQEYDWRAIYEKVRTLQPNATISGVAPDARWCGNEAGLCRDSEWSVVPIVGTEEAPAEKSEKTAFMIANNNIGGESMCCREDLGSRKRLAEHAQNNDRLYWYPAQVNMSTRPGWFYHEYEDDSVHPLKKLVNVYLNSVGGNCQFLLNIPPDKKGQINKHDVVRLKELGDFILKTFSKDMIVKNEKESDSEIILTCGNTPANLLMLCEDIEQGQRVEAFEVYVQENGEWKLVYNGTTIGYKKLIRLRKQVYDRIKVIFTESRAVPVIKTAGLYAMPPVSNQVDVMREDNGRVSFDLPLGGVVTIVTNGITTVKEFGIAKNDFKILNFSQELIDGYHMNSIFSEEETQYAKIPCADNMPAIDIDMGREYVLSGLHYMPVTSGFDANLNIFAYSLYGSCDGRNYSPIILDEELSNIYHNPILFKTAFPKDVTARYLRFEVKKSLNGEWLTIGKICPVAK